jgi:hypothetical protein
VLEDTGGEDGQEQDLVPTVGAAAAGVLRFSEERDPAVLTQFVRLRVIDPEGAYWRRGIEAATRWLRETGSSELRVPYTFVCPEDCWGSGSQISLLRGRDAGRQAGHRAGEPRHGLAPCTPPRGTPASPSPATTKSPHTGLTLYQVLDVLQDLLRCWTGTCTTCGRRLPSPRSNHRQPRT